MYVGRYELSAPTSGTRDRRLRGYLVSFARCPRVETDLAAAVSLFRFEFRSIDLDQSISSPVRRLARCICALFDSCYIFSPVSRFD